MNAPRDKLYEYACHHGNYALPGILAGTREEERAAASKQGTPVKVSGPDGLSYRQRAPHRDDGVAASHGA